MSGGSFDYLCFKEAERLLEENGMENLEAMIEALKTWPNSEKAVEMTQKILDKAKEFRALLESFGEDTEYNPIRGVWKAVEWQRSNDITPKGVEEALALYNEKV